MTTQWTGIPWGSPSPSAQGEAYDHVSLWSYRQAWPDAAALPGAACVSHAMSLASLLSGRPQHLSVAVAQPGPGLSTFHEVYVRLLPGRRPLGQLKSRGWWLSPCLAAAHAGGPAQSGSDAASSELRAGLLRQVCLGLNPTLVPPHPLPSPKSSLTSVPPSEALFSSLPQPRSSAMLFLLLHFLISSQFAPPQLPSPAMPKVKVKVKSLSPV